MLAPCSRSLWVPMMPQLCCALSTRALAPITPQHRRAPGMSPAPSQRDASTHQPGGCPSSS